MRIVLTRDAPGLPPELLGQLLDVRADELLVVVQQELDHETPEIVPPMPQQGELFPVSPMATASGPADCNSAVPQQHDVYTGTGNPVAGADRQVTNVASRDVCNPGGLQAPITPVVTNIQPLDVCNRDDSAAPGAGLDRGRAGAGAEAAVGAVDIDCRGWTFGQAVEAAKHLRLALTYDGQSVYTLETAAFGLAHFGDLAQAVSAIRSFGRMIDQLAAEAAAQRPTNPNPHWRPRL